MLESRREGNELEGSKLRYFEYLVSRYLAAASIPR